MTTTFVQDATTGKWSIPMDPNAKLDYIEDWTAWCAQYGDHLSSAVVTVNANGSGVTKVSSVVSGDTVVAWLQGDGTSTGTAQVDFVVTTTGGRTDARQFFLKVKTR